MFLYLVVYKDCNLGTGPNCKPTHMITHLNWLPWIIQQCTVSKCKGIQSWSLVLTTHCFDLLNELDSGVAWQMFLLPLICQTDDRHLPVCSFISVNVPPLCKTSRLFLRAETCMSNAIMTWRNVLSHQTPLMQTSKARWPLYNKGAENNQWRLYVKLLTLCKTKYDTGL